MTDDLVKRLKSLSIEITDREKHPYRWSDEFIAMKVNKAASRIEQLEEALREICSIPAQKRGSASHAMLVIAAAALGEKKDG
jgi:precorrin-2 methylase